VVLKNYLSLIRRNIFYIFLLLVLLLVFFILSIQVGDKFYSFKEMLNLTKSDFYIIYEIRVPRSLAAIFVGASLAIAALVMQYILKNPLASPFTLGISHGALFGASVSIMFFNSLYLEGFAFLGANVVTFLILALSKLRGFSATILILSGVAISALFGSLSMFLQYFSDDLELSAIINWSFGDLSRSEYNKVLVVAIIFIISFIIFYKKRWDFNSFDIVESENVGVDIKKITILSLLLATLLSSISVSYFGVIAFIGLIAPHFARLISGDFRFLLPLSALIGALLLLVSDFISRIILYPIEIPVGILTSFIGAPLFLALLIKIYRK